jgi:hypothetical protein
VVSLLLSSLFLSLAEVFGAVVVPDISSGMLVKDKLLDGFANDWACGSVSTVSSWLKLLHTVETCDIVGLQ